jgi:hypothetical protein
MDQLQHLKQVSSVDQYINEYESWMTQMKSGRTYLPQDFFVDRFLSGLKDNIKHVVQCQKPTSLLSAYWYARQYEKSNLSNTRRLQPFQAGPQAHFRQGPVRDNRNREGNIRPREPQKCWYCPQNWAIGHKCLPMPIQMQYSSKDDNHDEPQVLHADPRAADPAECVQAAHNGDDLMQISVAAYTGSPSDSTISLLLAIQGQSAIALADTGSTNTFLDYKFAVKHNIHMVPASARTVTVAGGGTLSSTAIAPNCTFTIQGKPFSATFRILQLQGSDIILGVNWFKLHNPVTFDFLARTITLGSKGTQHTF